MHRKTPTKNLILATLCALTLYGCARPNGPRVRFANANAQQLAAAESEDIVWYEFQPGDRFPVDFAFLGMAETGGEAMPMVVKRPFWIVVNRRRETIHFSFDNNRLIQNPFNRCAFLLGEGDRRGRAMLLMYVGPREEAPAQLRN